MTVEMKLYFKNNKQWETILSITILFLVLPLMAFRCDLLLWNSQLCSAYQVLVIRNTFYVLMTLHLTGAVLAAMLCQYMDCDPDLTLKWTCSVFIHGFLSFRHLLRMLYKYESGRPQEPLTKPMKFGVAEMAH